MSRPRPLAARTAAPPTRRRRRSRSRRPCRWAGRRPDPRWTARAAASIPVASPSVGRAVEDLAHGARHDRRALSCRRAARTQRGRPSQVGLVDDLSPVAGARPGRGAASALGLRVLHHEVPPSRSSTAARAAIASGRAGRRRCRRRAPRPGRGRGPRGRPGPGRPGCRAGCRSRRRRARRAPGMRVARRRGRRVTSSPSRSRLRTAHAWARSVSSTAYTVAAGHSCLDGERDGARPGGEVDDDRCVPAGERAQGQVDEQLGLGARHEDARARPRAPARGSTRGR